MFSNALLDGGSNVNILPEAKYHKLLNVTLHPAPFQVKMADQRRIQPLGQRRRSQIPDVFLYALLQKALLRVGRVGEHDGKLELTHLSNNFGAGRDLLRGSRKRETYVYKIGMMLMQTQLKIMIDLFHPLWAQLVVHPFVQFKFTNCIMTELVQTLYAYSL